MTDDSQCKAEAHTTGERCQHEATRGEYCHLHAEDGDPGGRKPLTIFDFDEQDLQRCLEMAEEGASRQQAALALGLDAKAFERFLEHDCNEQFRQRFKRARAEGWLKWARSETQHGRWMLAVSYGMGTDDDKGGDPAGSVDDLDEPEPDDEAFAEALEAMRAG